MSASESWLEFAVEFESLADTDKVNRAIALGALVWACLVETAPGLIVEVLDKVDGDSPCRADMRRQAQSGKPEPRRDDCWNTFVDALSDAFPKKVRHRRRGNGTNGRVAVMDGHCISSSDTCKFIASRTDVVHAEKEKWKKLFNAKDADVRRVAMALSNPADKRPYVAIVEDTLGVSRDKARKFYNKISGKLRREKG